MRRGALALRLACVLLPLAAAAPAEARAQRPAIALTFDDLPEHGPLPPGETRLAITRRIVAALKAAGIRHVHGFVNGKALERDPDMGAVLDAWRAAGHPLANHTWSHQSLDRTDVRSFVEEIRRNEPMLEVRMQGQDWRWFRYPFLHEGEDAEKRVAVRRELAARGYRIAGVTMSFGDFLWNDAYGRCAAAGDRKAISRLEKSFLAAAAQAAAVARRDSRALHSRDIPYVLLMHVGAFDARMLPRLIAQYRRQGFRFVSLEEATRDPAYAADIDPALPPAPSPQEQLRARRSIPASMPGYGPMLSAMCR